MQPPKPPLSLCKTCGAFYPKHKGHDCPVLKPLGNTEIIGKNAYPTKPCPNCENVSPGQVVSLSEDSMCAVCHKHVIPEILRRRAAVKQALSEKEKLDSGKKNDSDKPRFELLPPEAVEQIVHVLTRGAEKYQARNWEKGISYSRVYGALQRHLNEFWKGNNIDPEWGLHHLAHAGCCLLFLLTYEVRGMEKWDDRPKGDA